MLLSSLQRFTVFLSTQVRRLGTGLGNWLVGSPRLKAWFYPPLKVETPAERYRQFNEYYFADLHEQERMLGDEPRMAFYHTAINRHVKPGQRVIDLGTGTGILATYASRCGASQVYAIDHSTIIEHAKELAAENGVENVQFEDVHSTKFHLDEPVDVILHEQIGDFLFDEAMVPNVCDLRDRVLKKGGLILPSQFELFCEPVTLDDDRRIPYIWELTDVHGVDFSSMDRSRPQNPEYYRLASCDLGLVKHFVGDPEPLVKVDLYTIEEDTLPLTVTFTREVKRPGIIDGLAVFMKAKVDDDLVLSSSPIDPGRAPHWGFRILRLDQWRAELGETWEVSLTVKDWADPDTWTWTCENITGV
ncbi:MAG: methyltransferase domain-containing protein [Opitutaceae bacterium]|jgi:type I protein arginine methyltransferase|nr:methyltransferase domain-containing protein [Opitutaceae bacterium]